jgi:hypothetical protein
MHSGTEIHIDDRENGLHFSITHHANKEARLNVKDSQLTVENPLALTRKTGTVDCLVPLLK